MGRFKLVLIIEDNEMDNFVIKAMFERVQLAEEVYSVSNVFNALEFVQSLNSKILSADLQPEEICIFLDILMPFMDGNDFLDSMNKIWPELVPRVYVLSSLPVEEQDMYIQVEGVAGNIMKPIMEGSLRELFFGGYENE